MSANTTNEVNKRYKNKTYEYFTLLLRKDSGLKDKFQKYAETNSLSLNQLIIKAVDDYIENLDIADGYIEDLE